MTHDYCDLVDMTEERERFKISVKDCAAHLADLHRVYEAIGKPRGNVVLTVVGGTYHDENNAVV